MGNNVCPVNVPAREFFRGKKNAKAAQKKKAAGEKKGGKLAGGRP